MRLPSGYSTYDYSITPASKGWGQGWPTCNAGPGVTITTAISGTRFVNVHQRVAKLILLILNEIERRGFRFYNPGCWGGACRAISGTKAPSNHSWLLAIDMNAPENPYTSSGQHTIPEWAFAIFRAYGFGLGADYTGKKDWMHAEFMGTPNDADIMTAIAEQNFLEGDDMAQVPQDQWDAMYDFIMNQERAKEGWSYSAQAANALPGMEERLTERLGNIQQRFQVPNYPFDWFPHLNNQIQALSVQISAIDAIDSDGGVDVNALAVKLGEILPDEIKKSLGEALLK